MLKKNSAIALLIAFTANSSAGVDPDQDHRAPDMTGLVNSLINQEQRGYAEQERRRQNALLGVEDSEKETDNNTNNTPSVFETLVPSPEPTSSSVGEILNKAPQTFLQKKAAYVGMFISPKGVKVAEIFYDGVVNDYKEGDAAPGEGKIVKIEQNFIEIASSDQAAAPAEKNKIFMTSVASALEKEREQKESAPSLGLDGLTYGSDSGAGYVY